jgi:hypothetical protein
LKKDYEDRLREAEKTIQEQCRKEKSTLENLVNTLKGEVKTLKEFNDKLKIE